MFMTLERYDVCSNEACGARFDPDVSGWSGTCDDCAAIADDHVSGLHVAADPNCPACF